MLHSLSPSPPPRLEGFPGVSGREGRSRKVSPVRSSKGHRAGAGREAKLWPQIRSAPFSQAARKPRPHVPSASGLCLGGERLEWQRLSGRGGPQTGPGSPEDEGYRRRGGSRAHEASVPARAGGTYVALGVDGLQQPVPDLLRRRRSRCHCLGEAGGERPGQRAGGLRRGTRVTHSPASESGASCSPRRWRMRGRAGWRRGEPEPARARGAAATRGGGGAAGAAAAAAAASRTKLQ